MTRTTEVELELNEQPLDIVSQEPVSRLIKGPLVMTANHPMWDIQHAPLESVSGECSVIDGVLSP